MPRNLLKCLLLATVLTTYISCEKENNGLSHAPVVNAGTQKTIDTLAIGDTIRLQPVVSPTDSITYRWTVNGVATGMDSVFRFDAIAGGDYRVSFTASNRLGADSVIYNLHVTGKYENGFFIVNSGWPGHEIGSVDFYDYALDSLISNVYAVENPGKILATTSTTLLYGSIYGNRLFLLVKERLPLVSVDVNTMKENGRLANYRFDSNYAVIGLKESSALLSGVGGVQDLFYSDAAIRFNFNGSPVRNGGGDMLKADTKVFAISSKDGIVVLNENLNTIKTIGTHDLLGSAFRKYVGFVQTPDKNVWVAADSNIYRIDPATIAIDTIAINFKPTYPSFVINYDIRIAASSIENVVFLAGSTNDTPEAIYRYVKGDAGSTAQPFINLPSGQYLSGRGFGYDAKNNRLVLITRNSRGESDINSLLFYNASTGVLEKTLTYTRYCNPRMLVFRK